MNQKLKNRLIAESSFPLSMSLLLEGPEDAVKLISTAQKAFNSRNKKLGSLVGSLPSGAYQNVLKSFVGTLDTATTETTADAGDIADEDPDSADDKAAGMAGNIDNLNNQVRQILKVNTALMQYLAQQILKSNLHKGEFKDIPMVEVLKEADLLDQAKKEMAAAFDKVGNAGGVAKPKGFLAKMIGAVFGTTSKLEDMVEEIMKSKDQLIDSMLELTPLEIGNFAKAIVNYGKEDEAAAKDIENTTAEAQEEAGSDKMGGGEEGEEETEGEAEEGEGEAEGEEGEGEGEEAEEAPPIKSADLLKKVEKNPALGKGGALVVQRMIDTGLFDDLGIKVERALRNGSLSLLLEEKLASDEFEAAYELAAEEDPETFKDLSQKDVAKELNTVFADSEIDIQIEDPDAKELDLEDQSDEAVESLESDNPELIKTMDEFEGIDDKKEVILKVLRPIDIENLPGDTQGKADALVAQKELEKYVLQVFTGEGADLNDIIVQKNMGAYLSKRDEALKTYQQEMSKDIIIQLPTAMTAGPAKGVKLFIDILDAQKEAGIIKDPYEEAGAIESMSSFLSGDMASTTGKSRGSLKVAFVSKKNTLFPEGDIKFVMKTPDGEQKFKLEDYDLTKRGRNQIRNAVVNGARSLEDFQFKFIGTGFEEDEWVSPPEDHVWGKQLLKMIEKFNPDGEKEEEDKPEGEEKVRAKEDEDGNFVLPPEAKEMLQAAGIDIGGDEEPGEDAAEEGAEEGGEGEEEVKEESRDRMIRLQKLAGIL